MGVRDRAEAELGVSSRCAICQRSDVGLINERLRQGESQRSVAAKHEIPPQRLNEHAKGCLRITGRERSKSPTPILTPDTIRGSGPDTPGFVRTLSDRPPRARELIDPKAAISFEDQVRFIADRIVAGQWRDRRSIKWLCAEWLLGEDAVRERYRAGVVLAGEGRGDTAANLENAIARETAAADACEEQAEKLEHPTDNAGNPYAPSMDELALAAKYRALARAHWAMRARLEGLLVNRTSVSLEGDPRLAGLWPLLWRVLGELDAQIRAYAAEAAQLAGGVAPIAELPSATAMVKAEIVAYEERLGGRAGNEGKLAA